MTKEEAITIIKPLMLMMKNPKGEVASDGYYALDMAVKALEESMSVEKIKRERDTAIQQLKELGYGFGEKLENRNMPEVGETVLVMANTIDMAIYKGTKTTGFGGDKLIAFEDMWDFRTLRDDAKVISWQRVEERSK